MSLAETKRVIGLLQNRHSGEDWAFFHELRSTTGYRGHLGYIDCYAVGLWANNRGFIAYEVKSNRSDFQKDIAAFAQKQAVALANSTQFYYACPAKLIAPEEVPDVAGLMWADAGGMKVKKVAPLRSLENGLHPDFACSLARAAAGARPLLPAFKYEGRDITPEELEKLAKETHGKLEARLVERKAEEMAKKWAAADKSVAALDRIRKVLAVSGWGSQSWDDSEVEAICKRIGENNMAAMYAKQLPHLVEELSRVVKRLQESISKSGDNMSLPESAGDEPGAT